MKLIQISVAVSLDGYIDDCAPERLILSSPEDFEEIYSERAKFDAILIGAGTIRKDNPSLLLKRPRLEAKRLRNGLPRELIKVTLTASSQLDPKANFFASDGAKKIVLCPSSNLNDLKEQCGEKAQIVALNSLDPLSIIKKLKTFGIEKLFIEGGTTVLTAFLSAGVFHRLRLAIAPFFVGDEKSPRLVHAAKFVHDKQNHLTVLRAGILGDVTVIDFENKNVPCF